MTARLLVGLGVLVATTALGSAAAATQRAGTIEHFRTLLRATKETPVRADPTDKISAGLTLITSITDAQEFSPFLPPASTAKLKAADYGRVFVIAAFVQAPLEGYSISIRRVALVRTARHKRQFCVIASVRRPTSSVSTGQGWVGTHLVLLSARPFRTGAVSWNFPQAWVLRTPAGAVLAISRQQIGSTGRSAATGQPAACG